MPEVFSLQYLRMFLPALLLKMVRIKAGRKPHTGKEKRILIQVFYFLKEYLKWQGFQLQRGRRFKWKKCF